jgi:hypothetical protein
MMLDVAEDLHSDGDEKKKQGTKHEARRSQRVVLPGSNASAAAAAVRAQMKKIVPASTTRTQIEDTNTSCDLKFENVAFRKPYYPQEMQEVVPSVH